MRTLTEGICIKLLTGPRHNQNVQRACVLAMQMQMRQVTKPNSFAIVKGAHRPLDANQGELGILAHGYDPIVLA
jgi:hypothetical protein